MQIISLLCIQNTHRKIKGFLPWIFICSDLALPLFFFLPKNKKPEVLRNKPNLTDLQLLYFQSSKSIRTNMDVALPLWLTWMFTSKWFFKSKYVSSGHVLLFKNIELPGSENIPSVHQQEKHLWNLLRLEKFSLDSFAFPLSSHVQNIWQSKTPPQNHTNTALCLQGSDISHWKFWPELGEHLTNFYEPLAPLSFIQSCIFIAI